MLDSVKSGMTGLEGQINTEATRLRDHPPAAYGDAWIQCFILTLTFDASLLSTDLFGIDFLVGVPNVPLDPLNDNSGVLINGDHGDPDTEQNGLNDYIGPIQTAVNGFGAVNSDMAGMQSYGATMLQQATAQNTAAFDAADEAYNSLFSYFNGQDMPGLGTLVDTAIAAAGNAVALANDAATNGNLNGGGPGAPINDSFRNSGIVSLLGQLRDNLAGLESSISALDTQVISIANAVQDDRFDSPGAAALDASYESLYSSVDSKKNEVIAAIASIPT